MQLIKIYHNKYYFNALEKKSNRQNESRQRKGKNVCDLEKLTNKKVLELYFDGRQDKAMVNYKEETKYYRNITEEHISLI